MIKKTVLFKSSWANALFQVARYSIDHELYQKPPPSASLDKLKKDIADAKESMKWRTPIHEDITVWRSKFSSFDNEDQTSDYITKMQQPIDLSWSGIKKWWKDRKEFRDRYMQQYIPERHEILGADLAAAHFLLYRGGAVKFVHDKLWIRANKHGEFDIPKKFNPSFKIEAIRCDNMTLYYEGLDNIRNLDELKFLSFRNISMYGDWCLDRTSGSQYPKLEVLDISGTECTENGLYCLYRLPTLKMLIVDDPKKSLAFELACATLEEQNVNLTVYAAKDIHDE